MIDNIIQSLDTNKSLGAILIGKNRDLQYFTMHVLITKKKKNSDVSSTVEKSLNFLDKMCMCRMFDQPFTAQLDLHV